MIAKKVNCEYLLPRAIWDEYKTRRKGGVRYENIFWDVGVETQFEQNTDSRRYGHTNNDASTTWFAGPSVTFKLPEYNASLGVSAQFSLYQNYDAVAHIKNMDYPTAASLGERWKLEAKVAIAF